MSEEKTPVTIPGRPGSIGSGVPEPVEFEETGKVVQLMASRLAPDVGESDAEVDLAKALARLLDNRERARGAGDGNGGGGGEKTLKEIKKHKWLAALLSLLFGSGGMVGSYYALKAQAAANAENVEALKINGEKLEPRVTDTEENIRLIKVRVGTIDKSMKSIETSQKTISSGIDELKQKNVKRLEDELEETKRELRRANRDR